MRRTASLLLLSALALAGCTGADALRPADAVPGTYLMTTAGDGVATTVGSLVASSTTNGVTTDVTVPGSEIRITLAADGTTSGRLYLPNVADDDGSGTITMDVNLVGTWTVSGGVVTLHQSADTFLRDMPLTVTADGLVGDRTFGGVRVRLTLVRL